MRKRFVTTLLLALCALCAVFIAACGSMDVSGKTYVFSDITVSENEFVTAEDMKEMYNGITIAFNEDGTVTCEMMQDGSTWTQDGETVTITSGEFVEDFKISGNKLTWSAEENGVTFNLTFVEQ